MEPKDMKVWVVEPTTIKSTYAVCVLAQDEVEAITKAKRNKLFYIIEPFGPGFKAKAVMDAGGNVVEVWYDEYCAQKTIKILGWLR